MPTTAAGRYVRFAGGSAVVVAAVVGIGIVPTRRLAGDEGLPAMIAGCLIGWIAALAAGWPLAARSEKTPLARMQTALLAMGVRIAVVAALGAAAAFSGMLARAPLLFWLAASYMALLPLEVKLAISESRE